MIESTLEYPAIIGKLPAHGDFIARGVAYKARDGFDLWLSEWMELGREQHGGDFHAVYETAAPWLLESERCTAILMPSIDAVGRLYPILAISDPACLTQHLYDCLIDALQDGLSSDALRDRLRNIPRDGRGEARPGWFLPEGAEKALPSPDEVSAWQLIEGELK